MLRILISALALLLFTLPIGASPASEPIETLNGFFSDLIAQVYAAVDAVVDLMDGNHPDPEPVQTFNGDDDCTGPDCVDQELPPWPDPLG